MLSPFDVRRIVSADFVRCVQMVEPLATALGLDISEEPLLSESGFPGYEEEAVEIVRGLAHQGESIVLCTQRKVIPDLMERLSGADGFDLPNAHVKKGGVWVLSFDGRRLCDAEYFPPWV
jgi:8-oxo-dGTP diphosphatase